MTRYRLFAVSVLAGVLSVICLWYFSWGMLFKQDLWEAPAYVRWLVGGLLAAVVAVAAGETLRRTDEKSVETFAGTTAVAAARVLLVIQVAVFLYSNNVGPVRWIAAAAVRTVVTYGMARDLPPPPPS